MTGVRDVSPTSVVARPAAADPTPAGTLQRGLAILEVLGTGERPTVGELMDLVDLSRSAAYRILGVLREHGLVEWDSSATGRIGLGSGAILLGMTALTQTDAWASGRELLRRLADEAGESALMAVVDGPEIVYIAHEDRTAHVVGVRRLLGVRRPLQVTALGKAYAAALPERDLGELVAALRFGPGTATTLTTPAAFRRDLELVRSRGYAVDDGEHDAQVMCLGAAVLDHRELPVAAVSVAGPRERVLPRADELAALVRDTARAISLRLGCPPTAYAPNPPDADPVSTTTKGKS